eukprot:COSAG02_NODE_2206_length_9517_cov_3.928860_5_plen_67_part_00
MTVLPAVIVRDVLSAPCPHCPRDQGGVQNLTRMPEQLASMCKCPLVMADKMCFNSSAFSAPIHAGP